MTSHNNDNDNDDNQVRRRQMRQIRQITFIGLINLIYSNINYNRIFPPFIQNVARIIHLINQTSTRRRRYRAFDICFQLVNEEARNIYNLTFNYNIIKWVTNKFWINSSNVEKRFYNLLAQQVNSLI